MKDETSLLIGVRGILLIGVRGIWVSPVSKPRNVSGAGFGVCLTLLVSCSFRIFYCLPTVFNFSLIGVILGRQTVPSAPSRGPQHICFFGKSLFFT